MTAERPFSLADATARLTKAPEVYNIPAGVPFAEALADGILQRYAGQKEKLGAATVFLPSRRGARALKEAFEARLADTVTFLPKIYPLGESLEETTPPPPDAEEAERLLHTRLPVSDAVRQAALTEIITSEAQKNGESVSHSEAFALAQTLSETLDSLHSEQVPLSALRELDTGDHAESWQKNLDTLKIVIEDWPKFREEKGVIDSILFRNAALAAYTARLAHNPPDAPVIVAGSTGSMPATADFMAVIARLPEGCIVLPGADLELTANDKAALTPDHPQYGLHQLLKKLDVTESGVSPWPGAERYVTPRTLARQKLFREVTRPSGTSEVWREFRKRISDEELRIATEGLRVIAAPAEREEATAIALIMREAAETPGKSVALVTPNRILATRVQSALRRWNMQADDSAGVPVSDLPYGVFYKLLDDLFESDFSPDALLAFLKHPLTSLGKNPGDFKKAARLLEKRVFRGRKFPPGLSYLQEYVTTRIKECDAPDAHLRFHGDIAKRKTDFLRIAEFLREVRQGLEPMIAAPAYVTPREFIEAVEKTSATFAATDTFTGEDRLGYSEDYKAARRALEQFAAAGHLLGKTPQTALRRHLRETLVKETVRANYNVTPGIYIWGTPEARLQQTDIIILGGLTEESWPIIPDTGVWLSRTMRKDLGLTAPERRVGLSAHDFTQAACAPEVFMTYSKKADRKPNIPSPWLIRAESLLRGAFGETAIQNLHDTPYLAWSRQLDAPSEIVTDRKEAPPRPPVSARPRELSITEIETWRRDPYAIYAKKILNLQPLDPLHETQEMREYGIIAHAILEKFMQEFIARDFTPETARRRFAEISAQEIAERNVPPVDTPEMKIRLAATAEPFLADSFAQKESGFLPVRLEENGAITFNAPAGDFTLKGKIDRIDFSEASQTYIVYDYKTGGAPSDKTVLCGLSPQLPLGGALLREGGCMNLTEKSEIKGGYLVISGRERNNKAPFQRIPVCEKDNMTFTKAIEETLNGLKSYVAMYDKPETPYPPRLAPKSIRTQGDYDRLARISAGDPDDDEADDE